MRRSIEDSRPVGDFAPPVAEPPRLECAAARIVREEQPHDTVPILRESR